ncbi:MAG: polyphosphate kinase 2 family protein [Caldilineaceae bacterium]|nr:polyphosphate kinase 2 family protein [Caldilineaceae bacterium]
MVATEPASAGLLLTATGLQPVDASKQGKLTMDFYRVQPGSTIHLAQWDPSDPRAFAGDKKKGQARMVKLNAQLEQLQELLYAEAKHKVLIVLQAMDTGGKDGVIRHVFDGVNPQGVRVAAFKKPTPNELAHDYLWRIHQHTPANGEMAIFNRSHYEDVLVVRVHNLVPEAVWQRRYEQINAFEKLLAEEGTTILKFYLHIDQAEQKERLQARLDDPAKHWKFDKADLEERKRWPDYMSAYEELLSKTSTPWAPWYIIPANRKWYRNLVISQILVETLEGLKMSYPPPEDGLDAIVIA